METVVNKNTVWVCSGPSDTLTCPLLREDGSRTIQIEAVDVSFSDVTVTAFGLTGAAQVVEFPAGTEEICSVGGQDDFVMSKLEVSNVPAGTYTFRFTVV